MKFFNRPVKFSEYAIIVLVIISIIIKLNDISFTNRLFSREKGNLQQLCNDTILQVEIDGQITSKTKAIIDTNLNTDLERYAKHTIDGTFVKVKSGQPVFIRIDESYVNSSGGVLHIAEAHANGIAK